MKFGRAFLRSVQKVFEENAIAGHGFHWICLVAIMTLSFAGNCYQIYHAVQDLSKNVSDIDITYPTNYSVRFNPVCDYVTCSPFVLLPFVLFFATGALDHDLLSGDRAAEHRVPTS